MGDTPQRYLDARAFLRLETQTSRPAQGVVRVVSQGRYQPIPTMWPDEHGLPILMFREGRLEVGRGYRRPAAGTDMLWELVGAVVAAVVEVAVRAGRMLWARMHVPAEE